MTVTMLPSVEHIPAFYLRPRVSCKDGFSMSIQAGVYAYSQPRSNTEVYTHAEVGFPSHEESLLMPYIDFIEDDPTNSIYAFVPLEIIEAIIKKHGGLVSAIVLKRCEYCGSKVHDKDKCPNCGAPS